MVVTVSVAALDVAVPAALLKAARYWLPLLAVVVPAWCRCWSVLSGRRKCSSVSPERSTS